MLMTLLAALPLAHAEYPDGAWVLRSTHAELETQKAAALERTLAPLSLPVALIAKGRLEPMVTWCQGYRFTADEHSFQVACDDKPVVAVPRSGEATTWIGPTGKSHRIRLVDDGAAPAIRFEGEDGFHVVRYALDGDGGLVVEKTVHSEHLSVPLRWQMRYGPG